MAFKNIEPVQVLKSPLQYEADSRQRIALAKLEIGPNYLARFALEAPYAEDYLVRIGKLVIPKAAESPDDVFLEETPTKELLAAIFGFDRKNVKLLPLLKDKPVRRKAKSYNVTDDGMIITTSGQGMFTVPYLGGYLLPESYLPSKR